MWGGSEVVEAEVGGGVGLRGGRPRARRTCEGSGMLEVQAWAQSVRITNWVLELLC